MGNIQAAVLGLVALVATGGCERRPPGPGYPEVGCVVDDESATVPIARSEQALVAIPPPAIEFFLDDESGGPLRCRPSNDPCAELEGCVGAPVPVPIGLTATMAVVVRVIELNPIRVILDAELVGDPSFTLLQPSPSRLEADEDEAAFLVAVTPTIQGIVTAEVRIESDARNMPDTLEGVSITLQVEGVQP